MRQRRNSGGLSGSPLSLSSSEQLHGTFFAVTGLEDGVALSDESGKKRYRKQVIYTGDFVKRQPGKRDISFSVDDSLIDHWHRTFREMRAAGIDHPMPVGHTEDPEKRRATAVDTEIALDEQGRKSLYEIVEFTDPKHEDLVHSNVSIFCPPEMTSGSGKTWKWPLKHTAFTDYPVIPGLEKFQAIAASFDVDLELEYPMTAMPTQVGQQPAAPPAAPQPGAVTIQTIAAKLGIPPTTPPDQMLVAIDAKVTQLTAGQPKPPAAPGTTGAAPNPFGGKPMGMSLANIPEHLVKMAKENRERKLLDLVTANKITSAVARDLQAQYCADEPIALSLSSVEPTDNFDQIIASLDKMPKGKTGSSTGSQSTTLLSKGGDGEQSSVVKSAERRRVAATNGHG